MLKKLYFLLLFSVIYTPAQTTLKLNEIMFYPVSGNNEFIELFNSGTESIDLNGFSIKYYSASADEITDAGEGTILNPETYAVIFEGDYDLVTGIYSGMIPEEALILKIADNSFGSTGMSNTSDRPVWLINASDDTLDVYMYSADNSQSQSDEKIHFESDSAQANWNNSVAVNGTPGFRNSVTPFDYDLGISSVIVLPEIPLEGDNISISVMIQNHGESNADNFSVRIFNDTNLDSLPQSGEQISSQSYNNLNSGDSVSAYAVIQSAASGLFNIIVKIYYTSDEDTTNNTAYRSFIVYPPGTGYNDVVINEIMYAPSSDEPEWVEIFNRTQDDINLKGWTFSDNSTTKVITPDDFYIPAESYVVLTRDSSILDYYTIPSAIIEFSLPALNNTGDQAVIKDSLGSLIDSLYYVPAWGGADGRSLEKIIAEAPGVLQSNWTTSESIFKATPGKVNSVTPKDNDLKISSFMPSADFVIIGQTAQFEIIIKNAGLNISPAFSLSLFYDINKDSTAEPSELITALNSGSLIPGDSVQLYTSTNNFIEGTNYYIAKLTASPDEDTTNNTAFTHFRGITINVNRNDLIINEFMSEPDSPQPEWIEIYNRSDKPVGLKNFRVADSRDTVTINTEDEIVNSLSYAVIADDSSISEYFNIPSLLLIKSLPALNNSGDKIMLLDSLNRVIDSLEYTSEWNSKQGKSLERIDSEGPSNDKINWASSKSIYNGTPGCLNSVTPKDFDIAVKDIVTSPLYPAFGDDVSIAILTGNPGLNTAVFSLNLYEDTDLDSLPDVLLETIQDLTLGPGDSSLIETGYTINNIRNMHGCYAEALFDADMDTSNNHIINYVSPGYNSGSLVINEIMYAPSSGDPEWIEILNISSDSVNMKEWSLSDILNSPTQNFITESDFYLRPGGFALIARDSSFYSLHPELPDIFITNFGILGNTEDGVILYDNRNAVIDSVLYTSKWGSVKGFSIERISASGSSVDSSNWAASLSPSKSTPGRPNSVINIEEGERNSVVINEIMFDPDLDNCEFLEFYNRSPDTINIGGWCVEDGQGNLNNLSYVYFILPPGSCFVLAGDSIIMQKYSLGDFNNISFAEGSGPGLSNAGELILLKDFRGNIIDSVCYSSGWHNRNISITKNKSLERINPGLDGNYNQNWSTCVSPEGATPGKMNSIFTDNNNRHGSISVSPNPFSPDNDGFEDFSIINYTLTQAVSQIRIKIFDNKGRLVRTVVNNQASSSQGSVIFDGLGDDGRALRMGIYIIFLEALNDFSRTVENLKTVIVVARRL